ncbi:MerR family transcriptional regulator [Salinicoccus sp. HZC-1]|uniref:MerR family transcriptional regulator n=1 Tax=Salinicoccus sp. HZC-1 TaxID=3385497 RepID=UPI00398A7824
MDMKVKEVAGLVGVSVRTLHHYDKIGLLEPDEVTETGYRKYSEEDLELLQQILFFKKLGFSLENIKKMIYNPHYNRQEALEMQKRMLKDEAAKIDQMIKTIDKTLLHMKGNIEMTNEEKFEGIDFTNNPYEEEAREKWGNDAVDESERRINRMAGQDQEELKRRFDEIYKNIAEIRHTDPESEKAQKAIEEWYEYLNDIGNYSPEVFMGLGQMYIADERFTKNIDQYGEGLAQFMSEAMRVFYEKRK